MAMQLTDNIDKNKIQRIDSPVRQRLLSLKQASKYLGRGEDSMREMIYGHVFQVIQIGEKSKMWIDLQDLDAWIESNKKYA